MKIYNIRIILGILFILFFISNSYGQNQKIEFEYLTVNEGLSSNYIRYIFKDGEGFLWFGTDKGLNKYNGRTIEKFNHNTSDLRSLLDDKIVCVFEDHLDKLWVSTALGLNLLNREDYNFKPYALPKETFSEVNEVIGMLQDESNSTFVVTKFALYEFSSQAGYRKLFSEHDLKLFSSISCYKYYDGALYLGTWTGHLFKYSVKEKTVVEVPLRSIPRFDYQPLYCIHADNGSLFVSLGGEGVFHCNIGLTGTFKQVFAGSQEGSNKVTSIQKDNLSNYLLATEYGFFYLDQNFSLVSRYSNTFEKESINNNYCTFAYSDNTNIRWIGTRYGGVNKYDPNKLKFRDSFDEINTSVNEKERSVKCFFQDKDMAIWIGGDFGLRKFSSNKESIQSWPLENIYKNTENPGGVASIHEGPNGNLWLGNWGKGLSLFNPSTGTNISFTKFLKSKTKKGDCILNIYTIGETLHLFTFEGLAKFNKTTLESKWYTHVELDSTSVSNNSMISYCVDKDENIWMGTENGLNKIDYRTEKVTRYFHQTNNPNSIASNCIYSLLKDSNGNIWIGTSNGLSMFDPEKKTFKQNALPEVSGQKVFSIQEDNRNFIWISNGLGLVKFDIKKGEAKIYTGNDGVHKGLEYSYKGLSGELFFGGVNGITSFIPDKIIDNQFIPRVIISKFKLFNKEITNGKGSVLQNNISNTKKIHLEHDQSSFSFEFSSLNYTLPEKNRFKYRLQGFDKNWTLAGISEQATYTNVPPGNYTFIVMGSNNDGLWNTDGTKLSIIIRPAWYWNAWSQTIYAFIVLILTVLVYRFLLYRQILSHELELERMGRHQEEERFQEKFNFFTNVSHQIRTPLTLISGSVEQITDELRNNPVVLKRLETVNRNTLKLLNLVNQLIDFKKFETEKSTQISKVNVVDTLKELHINYADIAQHKNIELIFETNIDSLQVYIDKDKLDKILNNLIHNALKFTPEYGKVTTRIEASSNVLKIFVIDTGIGIASEDMPNLFKRFWRAKQQKEDIGGIGLAYAKDLVATMNGIISANSVVGKGTTFLLEFPQVSIIQETGNQESINTTEDGPTRENGKSHVLIIEDNDEMRHFIRETLEKDYCVDSEKDALAGLKALKSFIPEIIISDVMMPGMDGISFCKEIKSNLLISHIPIILLTANALEESIISGYDSGADDYITKPFSSKILLKRVENLIESRKNLRSKYVKEMFPDLKELTTSRPDEDFIKNAMKIVEENYGDSDFEAIKFSREMAVSRTLLYTKLKSITGQSVNEFIRTIRLKKAAWLLTNSNKQVTDIAFTVGFSNAAYFTKCFTDQFGVSPRKYAEQNRNE
jgi:signal transduction histidine kinase/ligand-binding sensor domain-containing protein/AraC-like DNA-binding protein